ncbi:MAG: hypothetical protein HKN10_15755 [Myxococcales bacterium]|nr:hypothetical protein [Myxococcales bacterium]
MARSRRSKVVVVVLVSLLGCGGDAPEVVAEATETMVCVTAVDAALTSVRVSSPNLDASLLLSDEALASLRASSPDYDPTLILTDVAGDVAVTPPWWIEAGGELAGARCYNFMNFHPNVPREFEVRVEAGGFVTEVLVPVARSFDGLTLFGRPLECSKTREWEPADGTFQARETWGVLEVPPFSQYTSTSCGDYVIRDGESVPLDSPCTSYFRQDQGGGRVELMCEQRRTELDGSVVGPGRRFYVRTDDFEPTVHRSATGNP